MTAAWVLIINALEMARRDLEDVSDQRIPEWVYGAVRRVLQPTRSRKSSRPALCAQIWGTVVIFWSFTVVRHAK